MEPGRVALFHRHVLDGQGGGPIDDVHRQRAPLEGAVGLVVPHFVLDAYRLSVVDLSAPGSPVDRDRSPLVPVVLGELPADRRHPGDAVVVPLGAHAAVDAQDDPPSVDADRHPVFQLRGLFTQPDAVGEGAPVPVDHEGSAPVVHTVPVRVHLHAAAPVLGRILGVDGRGGQGQQDRKGDGEDGEETTAEAEGQSRFLDMPRHHAPESSSATGNSSKGPPTCGPGRSESSGAGEPGRRMVVRGRGRSSSAGVANAGQGAVTRGSGCSPGKQPTSSRIGVDRR